jgi:hypothetical protein
MLALGLLFILGAAAVTAGALYDGGDSASFELFGQTIGTTISGVFMAGVATMLVFALGVWMLTSAMARSRRKRIERREARARQRESVTQIEQERAQLRAENEALQQRLAAESRPGTATATGAGTATASGAGRTAGRDETARPDTGLRPSDGDGPVVDQRTDLTSREGQRAGSQPSRHRDEI